MCASLSFGIQSHVTVEVREHGVLHRVAFLVGTLNVESLSSLHDIHATCMLTCLLCPGLRAQRYGSDLSTRLPDLRWELRLST